MKDFEELYKLYFRDVYRYCLALTKDPHTAEDVSADTFSKALRNLRHFRGECDVRTWLCQIAKNTYISYCRKQNRINELPDIPIDSGFRFEQQIEDRELAHQIDRFIQTMEDPYRQVFILRTYYELPYAQIADTLGRTESWARVTYTRAKRMIQSWVKESEHG